MKRLKVAVFVLFSAVLAHVCLAQPLPSQFATQRIVTLSFNEVVLHTSEAQKALATLQAQFAPRQAKLQALNDEVELLRKQTATNSEKLSDADRSMRADLLDRKEKQLQREAEYFKTDSQAESQQVFQRVAQKVFVFLQTYAQQHGYSAVIDRGSDTAPIVWYAASNIDITDQILKAYDAQSGTSGPQPSKSPDGRGGVQPPASLPDSPSSHP